MKAGAILVGGGILVGAYLLLSSRHIGLSPVTPLPTGTVTASPGAVAAGGTNQWDVIGKGVDVIGGWFSDLFGTSEAKTNSSAVAGFLRR